MGNRLGLDLVVLDPAATVQDLIDAFAPYATGSPVHKRYLGGPGSCLGCVESCCTVSIIAPDRLSFHATRARLGLTVPEMAARFLDSERLQQGVVHYRSRPCAFLADHLCSIYPERSLICRTFICTDYSPDLEDLIHNAIGAGLQALRHDLLAAGLELPPPAEELVQQAGTEYEREFLRFYIRWSRGYVLEENGASYPVAGAENPWLKAESYQELPLRAFCTPGQWQRLTRSER